VGNAYVLCSKPRPSRCRGGEFVRHRQVPARQTGYTAAAVVRPGLSSDFAPESDSEIARVLERHSLRRPYVLGVATVEPRRGLDSLVRAFCALQARAEFKDYTLVLVGERGWQDSSLIRLFKSSGSRNHLARIRRR
jgi:glycosyltransferase involved in cell wall biosynthesis